ncbi:unnamed protein product [Staurois parvus]|uniref:Uncharacterized protein n=1 Tax=Staurois parvus TaxID=386267 RepID=A0ABN9BTC0_9NEOB|nr:unnamed protein product [Staurois parvus]
MQSVLDAPIGDQHIQDQGRTDHLETWALPEGPGCPWYLFYRLF